MNGGKSTHTHTFDATKLFFRSRPPQSLQNTGTFIIHFLFEHFSRTKNNPSASNSTPSNLEDVSKYPILFAELIGFGWTVEELTKLAGGNLLRVMKEVESIRDKMRKEKIPPNEDIYANRIENPHKCQSN